MIIRIEGNTSRFLDKCINNHINILNVKYFDNYILITINKNDYKKIKKISYYVKLTKVKNTGLTFIKDVLVKYWYDFLMIILFIILIYLQSNIIISVDIKHENQTLKDNVKSILYSYKIKPFTIAKSNKELNEISNDILRNNRDTLDFIAITKEGMHLKVSFEERIIKTIEDEASYCNIVSTKDAVVNKINVYKGISLIEKNQSVKAGDILISGDLILNEEIKEQVCANGEIIGTTWYKINVTYPKSQTIIKKTGKKSYNLSINNKLFLKNKYEKYQIETKFKIFNIKFVKIIETTEEKEEYSDEDVRKRAINKAKEELLKKKSHKIEIIEEKVLKESDFNSKIELELFISVKENIGIQKVGEINDPKQSIQHPN